MDSDIAELIASLLRRQTVLALGVVVEGKPVLGLTPFALRPDWGALFVHTSRLARHSRGLEEGAPFSALLQDVDTTGLDPFQRPRLTLEGNVHLLARDSPEWSTARDIYVQRLPSGARMFALGDFTLHELLIERGRFVGGFAAAHTVTPAILGQLAPA